MTITEQKYELLNINCMLLNIATIPAAINSEYLISRLFVDGNIQLFTASLSFVIGPK